MNKDIAKSLALLTGLKNNMPEGRHQEVESKYVNQYLYAVELLEKETGEDLSEFKIPLSMVKAQVIMSSQRGNVYTDDSYCPRAFLLVKIDSILSYFTFVFQPDEIRNKLGFSIEKNSR
jgi:hypothetical protein